MRFVLSGLSPSCCADLAWVSESEEEPESVLSPFSPFGSRTGLTGYEKLGSAGASNGLKDLSTGFAELLTRTRRVARLKDCNLKFELKRQVTKGDGFSRLISAGRAV